MFEPRPKEQDYALLKDVEHPEKNCYGTDIETVPAGHGLRGKSLNINGDPEIGDNPNRYKQHGFYFNADNCISCHACEAACSEKNDLPAHIAFRSVGYVEGGSYPSYQRLNISMACNHCDDPVCLKGCPTRAYTKFAEYGAVLQDPDICFGCGYCTWVCPYNAPQLDTSAGHVSKCNMCVDRLEVGLKPACASACLAGALDFGVVETTPDNRSQLKTSIPGFPTPEITHPNIRFQQTRSLPASMSRPDSMPLRYEKTGSADDHQPGVDATSDDRQWNLKKLSTRENPLVIFTLISQAVIGAFLMLFLGELAGFPTLTIASHPVALPLTLLGLIGIQTLALVLSTLHLGRPHRFYRAFNNLRYSPVSREVAGIAVFYNFLGAYGLVLTFPVLTSWVSPQLTTLLVSFLGWGACLSGLAALYFMHCIYRIPARPFWNHWQVLSSFYGNMLTLGALLVLVTYVSVQLYSGAAAGTEVQALALLAAAGLMLQGIGMSAHHNDLSKGPGEGRAALYTLTVEFGKTWIARNAGMFAGLLVVGGLMLMPLVTVTGWLFLLLATGLVALTAIVDRALFYAVVIPTTMPGAFFWRNRGFEEHARETGLADMPQTGVLPEAH